MTEWFVYVQREGDNRRAIVTGPYATQEEADAAVRPSTELAMATVRDGERLWFASWGVCSAPAGLLTAKLGKISA